MKTPDEEIEELFICDDCDCESYYEHYTRVPIDFRKDEWICKANVPENQCKVYRKVQGKRYIDKILQVNRSAVIYAFKPVIIGCSIFIAAIILYHIFITT